MSFQSTSSRTRQHTSLGWWRRELSSKSESQGHSTDQRGLWPLEPGPSVNLLRSASSLGKGGGSSPCKESLWLPRETIHPMHPKFRDTLLAPATDPWHTGHFTWSEWPMLFKPVFTKSEAQAAKDPQKIWAVLTSPTRETRKHRAFHPREVFERPCTFKMEKEKKKFFFFC